MEILGYLASVLIGISLGLIGGGGSILTVPILVYLFGIGAEHATSYSLFIVGITAMTGAYRHYKLGNLEIKSGLAFGLPSVLSLLLVRKLLLPALPDVIGQIGSTTITKNLLIMLVFALLMLAASIAMIKPSAQPTKTQKPQRNKLALIGLLIGFITGFLGAGGGFLIIPALLFFAGIPMKQAIGTSLLIISINSAIGFAGDALGGAPIDYSLLLTISAIAIVGMLIGTQLSKKINGAQLKPAFGWFVLLMGVYILVKELSA